MFCEHTCACSLSWAAQAHHPGTRGPPCASLVLQHLAQTPEWLQTLLWWRWQLCSSIEVLP